MYVLVLKTTYKYRLCIILFYDRQLFTHTHTHTHSPIMCVFAHLHILYAYVCYVYSYYVLDLRQSSFEWHTCILSANTPHDVCVLSALPFQEESLNAVEKLCMVLVLVTSCLRSIYLQTLVLSADLTLRHSN